MRQFLIFMCGVLSVFIGLAGAICAIQTIVTGLPIMVVIAVIFLIVWVAIVVLWLRNNCPEKLVNKLLGE